MAGLNIAVSPGLPFRQGRSDLWRKGLQQLRRHALPDALWTSLLGKVGGTPGELRDIFHSCNMEVS